jgi:hypothetical protein
MSELGPFTSDLSIIAGGLTGLVMTILLSRVALKAFFLVAAKSSISSDAQFWLSFDD